MSWTYYWILVAMVAALLTMVMLKPARIFEYPYFMGATMFGFILPQGLSLLRFPGEASEEVIAGAMLMSCLCLAACWLGYQLPINRVIAYHTSKPVNSRRLFDVGVVFIIVAYFFEYKISQMTEDETGGTMWTGRVTIYGTLSLLSLPGFAIALRTALKQGTLPAWLATIAGAVHPILTSVVGGRRENTALFALTIALCFYFQFKKAPPRLVIIGVLVFATLAIPATGIYRGAVSEEGVQAATKLTSVNMVQNFKDFVNGESILELRNAAMIIDSTRRTGDYEWGRAYWDQLVYRFVPAQFVGAELKNRLMFVSAEERLSGEVRDSSYVASRGSTVTGMGDSFQQFGWFGCVFFVFIAVVFRSLWWAAHQQEAIFAQLFYISITTSGMRALTHQTLDFLPALVYNGIFLGLAFIYSHESQQKQPVGKSRARKMKKVEVER